MTTPDAQVVHNVDIEIEQGGNWVWPLGVIATQIGVTGPAVVRNTAYAVGDRVTPAAPNGYAYECTAEGTSHASVEPTWPTVVGRTVADGTVTWDCAGTVVDRNYLIDTSDYSASLILRATDYDGEGILDLGNPLNITLGFSPAKWATNTAYGVGQQVVPKSGLNGFVYECTVAGTSHASTEPTWPMTQGVTVSDGTARWRCEAAETVDNGLVSNVVVEMSGAQTEALPDWGRGVYTFQLFDSFGNLALWVDGTAHLRRQARYEFS